MIMYLMNEDMLASGEEHLLRILLAIARSLVFSDHEILMYEEFFPFWQYFLKLLGYLSRRKAYRFSISIIFLWTSVDCARPVRFIR